MYINGSKIERIIFTRLPKGAAISYQLAGWQFSKEFVSEEKALEFQEKLKKAAVAARTKLTEIL